MVTRSSRPARLLSVVSDLQACRHRAAARFTSQKVNLGAGASFQSESPVCRAMPLDMALPGRRQPENQTIPPISPRESFLGT